MKNLLITIILVLTSHQLYAQNAWVDLSNEQQKLLLPFQSEWDNLDTQAKSKLLSNTDKWLNMTPLERKESRQKLNKFKQLPLAEQQRIKNKVKRYKQMSEEDRMLLYQAQKKFKQLNPEQRRKLKKRYNQLPAEQREKRVIQHMKRQQGKNFVNQFDINKRQRIIQMFKSLPETKRIKLRTYLRNMSPHQRHAYTLNLLEMNASDRITAIEEI